MKFRLLEYIRCPDCKSNLKLLEECVVSSEVFEGRLCCSGCGRQYPILEGIPRLLPSYPKTLPDEKRRTASSYGYLWNRSTLTNPPGGHVPYHFDRMEQLLSLPPSRGFVLDAGCGAGIDLANQAQRLGVEVIGVELSEGGCRMSFRRSSVFPAAHLIQGDICQLPFGDDSFDFIYSFGVLHHLSSPLEGLRELVRVLKPGARIAVYLYEDFSNRSWVWRWPLFVANRLRWVTHRLPHPLLYLLCQLASPVVYLLFTVPFQLLHRIPILKSVAAQFPFRHAKRPFGLVGDLYDRFSTPVEHRYNRAGLSSLFENVGLKEVTIANERGWMISARRPLEVLVQASST